MREWWEWRADIFKVEGWGYHIAPHQRGDTDAQTGEAPHLTMATSLRWRPTRRWADRTAKRIIRRMNKEERQQRCPVLVAIIELDDQGCP